MSVDGHLSNVGFKGAFTVSAQVKASYKLSDEFKKGPAKPKKVAKKKVRPR